MPEAPHLVIVDGHALCYQAFHALPPMAAPDGRATQVPYGVLSATFKLLRTLKPAAMVVAFDAKGPTFRHLAYAEYKIQRAPAPEGLHDQIDLLKGVLDALGIARLERQGFEADDLLGTLARQAVEAGHKVTLVTSDKDAWQLLSDRVSLFDPRKDRRMGPEELLAERGLSPEQVPDYLALTGDSSDNVPGVPGVGPKTAVKLLASAGSLKSLLQDPAKHASERVAQALKAGAGQAGESLALATLDLRVPVTFDAEACRPPSKLFPEGRAVLQSLGFQRFLAELPSDLPDAPATEVEAPAPAMAKPKDLAALTGLCGIAPAQGGAFAVADGARCLLMPASKLPDCKDVRFAGHDLKTVLLAAPEAAESLAFDTLLAGYLLNPEGTHRLEDLAREHLQRELPLPPAPTRGGKKKEEEPPEAASARAAARAAASRDLAGPLRARLEADGLAELFDGMEMPLIPILAAMEREGIGLDTKALAAISGEIGGKLSTLEGRIHTLAGGPFAIGSPRQLAHVLFEVLELPTGRKGKTGYSTDADVLDDLAQKHDLPALVLEYRQLEKLRNTYVDALPALLGKDGRLHTSFNQAVAATGRLSSSNPNLQNIPIRTELGRRIREAFLPHGKGSVLLTADYSQIELRILAHCADDTELKRAFRHGEDVHAITAAQIHGVPAAEVTPGMRDFAKTVNFSVIYGKTAFTLARELKCPQKEAQAFIDAYFRHFAGVKAFIARTVEGAREKGFVTTLSGRRRSVPFLRSPNPVQRAAAERVAVNTVIQGSAADLMKLAMIRVDWAIRGAKARILLQIHDELVLDVPEREARLTAGAVREAMEGAMALDVPLVVDTAWGATWREAAG